MPISTDTPTAETARPAAPNPSPPMPEPQHWIAEACGDDLSGDDPAATQGPAR